MKDRFIIIMGIVFIIASGVIYTLERMAATIAGSIELAGFYTAHISGTVPSTVMPGFGDNIVVPAFLIIGLAFFAYASLRKK
ncbi:hypothetical protein E0485_20395 [Paenibacillus albiflavus]|uniref:Uncharacterized protein n=1 Tax=Paenibacillus albiflavus TaxID=2545760 RepID=A0A4R4E4Y3_9BACL|nr:hypothetical protein [Paenibacillus albiflavus]TCZ74037.1 hypothetical protein E0485_20395 [Paenibacillus albiflavus]